MIRKLLIYSIVLFVVVLVLRSMFIVDFRFYKEEFLIKRNYRQNDETFKNIRTDFKNFPSIELNFRDEGYMDLKLRSHNLFNSQKSNKADSVGNLDIPQITIYDTIAYFNKDYYQYYLLDMWIEDSILNIKTTDSLFKISEFCEISYSGYMKSGFMKKIFEFSNLDTPQIELIKQKLRKLNCFGYEKDISGNLIINYRTNFRMFDAFSYLVINDERDSSKILSEFYTKHGLIENNIYWFHYEKLHVSYFSYMKLGDRKI